MKHEILHKMFAGLKPTSVFEVGCSEGGMLEDIGIRYGNVKLGGIDKDKEAVTKAGEMLKRWPRALYYGDVRAVPWPIEGKFDVVFCVGLLMYVANPLSVIQEMIHLTSGRVIIAEPIYTESGNVFDSKTGKPFDSYGERYNHDYLRTFTGAGLNPKREQFGDKLIYTL